MRRSWPFSIFASIVLHASICGLLWLVSADLFSSKTTSLEAPFLITIIETPTPVRHDVLNGTNIPQGRRPGKQRIRRYSVGDFGIGHATGAGDTHESANEGSTGQRGLEQINELYPLTLQIYKRIDENLTYPEALILYERAGRVSIKLMINTDGTLDKDKTLANAVDGILKVHTLQSLDQAFAKPIFFRTKPVHPISLDLTFDFFSRFDTEPVQFPPAIVQNQLYFIRAHTMTAALQAWQKTTFRETTRGAALDLMPFFDKVALALKKREYRKMGIDPLDRYRSDPRY